MQNRDRIIAALADVELCDDCLSIAASVFPRNQVYSICTSLSKVSVIHRHHGMCEHCHKAKNTNRILKTTTSLINEHESATPPDPQSRPWYWEGNVQSKVVDYLVQNNYTIRSVADTAARTPGVDVIALSYGGKEIWISVKGYPDKSSNVQARHWFSGAIFDLILYHGEKPEVDLAIALPDGFTTYSNLLPRIKWLKEALPFKVYWVCENGRVRLE